MKYVKPKRRQSDIFSLTTDLLYGILILALITIVYLMYGGKII